MYHLNLHYRLHCQTLIDLFVPCFQFLYFSRLSLCSELAYVSRVYKVQATLRVGELTGQLANYQPLSLCQNK